MINKSWGLSGHLSLKFGFAEITFSEKITFFFIILRKVQVSAKESEKNQQLPLSAQSKDENGSGKASGAAAIPDKPDTNTVETEEQFYTKVRFWVEFEFADWLTFTVSRLKSE